MAVTSRKNEYQGINAHLNSELQSPYGGWEGFHNSHITHIVEAIMSSLPAGYVIEPEQSFQIRAENPHSGEPVVPQEAKPDAAIYRPMLREVHQATSSLATAPTTIFDLVETIEDPENYMSAAVIRRFQNNRMGEPVAWIEALSPTNKPGGSGYDQYTRKRNGALRAGIIMVELDYVHETLPITSRIAPYPREGEFPYYVLVTVPRPVYEKGKTFLYGFRVDESMPVIYIPLLGKDYVELDCGATYNRTFAIFHHRVDYAQEPPRMHTYRAEDQQRIRARMAAVLEAQRQT